MMFTWLHEHANRLTVAAIGLGILVAFLYFKALFQGASGFDVDIQNAGKPTWWWIFGYRSVESEWSHLKIMVWLLLSVGTGVIAYYQLPGGFPRFSNNPHIAVRGVALL